ncbi:chlorophyll a/b-binding protein [Prochlorothrix hollandica]|nr:chlorophyll a/b-binding protein [Prochlorothrix hollandica]
MTTPTAEPSTPESMAAVPQPSQVPEPVRPKTGFNRYAERLNGRLAMLAFTAVIVVELLTGHGILHWFGLS